jgi:rubrerythrin
VQGVLKEIFDAYKECANRIEGWTHMTKQDLANGYVDEEERGNIHKRDSYFAALMCKYAYMVPYLYEKSKSSRLEIEDMVYWVAESLMIGLKYRRWRDPSFAISKDPKAVEKIFNQCITSTRQRWYKYFNQEKRRDDYNNLYSLNDLLEDFGDSEECMNVVDDSLYTSETELSCRQMIDRYVSEGKIVKAFIVDGICFFNSFKEEKDDKGIKHEQFNEKRLALHLHNLDDKFESYFMEKYHINHEVFLQNVQKIRKMKSNKLYRMSQINKWKCSYCGAEIEEKEAPKTCPLCGYEQGYFNIPLSDD